MATPRALRARSPPSAPSRRRSWACSSSWPGPSTPSTTGWAPLRVQLQNSHHGGLSDPFVTLFDDAKGVFHHHVGTALHVPWVLLALAMLIVCWRRLPAPYTLFAAAVLAVAVSGSNLDSFERYALSAFPLSIAAALLLKPSQIERAVLTLLAAGLAGYALLAFLNISVP